MNPPHSATDKRQCIAWHGWRLELPAEWNPLRIEGDWRRGSMLLADLQRPRVGLRWGVIKRKRFDALAWARRAIRDEVGLLASRQARTLPLKNPDLEASLLYVDPQPPRSDVWVAFSRATGRGVQLIYHAQRRDDVLAERIVPTLVDSSIDQPTPWSIFDLSCLAPAGMMLKSHQFSAGDLRLVFDDRQRFVSIRQIAVAKLALSRLPLEQWLAREQRTRATHYRASNNLLHMQHETDDGRALHGIARRMARRRRFFFMTRLPRELIVAALHDPHRDRLLLMQASDRELLQEMARTIGHRE